MISISPIFRTTSYISVETNLYRSELQNLMEQPCYPSRKRFSLFRSLKLSLFSCVCTCWHNALTWSIFTYCWEPSTWVPNSFKFDFFGAFVKKSFAAFMKIVIEFFHTLPGLSRLALPIIHERSWPFSITPTTLAVRNLENKVSEHP